MSWPAVIAGASFAGLAVAAELEEEVALLDRFPVGSHQTSACATFVSTMEDFGLQRAILRSFDTVILHLPRPVEVDLLDPLCTFDYGLLCRELLSQGRSRFFQADVRGMTDHTVHTNRGGFASALLVDATGWRATLGCSIDPRLVDRRRLTFGLETQVDIHENMMHFFVDPRLIRWGAAWIFPVDRGCRVGVASYGGANGLRGALDLLLHDVAATTGPIHGGAIPWGLRPGTVRDIFLVGDAAGLAPPLTAEGIRLSLRYGRYCGRLLNRVLSGSLSSKEALQQYRSAVRRLRRTYRLLEFFQRGLGHGWDPLYGALIRPKKAQNAFMKLYLDS